MEVLWNPGSIGNSGNGGGRAGNPVGRDKGGNGGGGFGIATPSVAVFVPSQGPAMVGGLGMGGLRVGRGVMSSPLMISCSETSLSVEDIPEQKGGVKT